MIEDVETAVNRALAARATISEDGARAYLSGRFRAHNPYPFGSDERALWLAGWEGERRRERDSQRAKRHLGDYRAWPPTRHRA